MQSSCCMVSSLSLTPPLPVNIHPAGAHTSLHLLSRLLNSVLSATFVSTSLFFSRVICEVYLHPQRGQSLSDGSLLLGLLLAVHKGCMRTLIPQPKLELLTAPQKL
jgi:hypothetical protein